ncbi:MAG: hypothetical protein ACRD8O_24700, partial [Bryobacteraceae bacterium]
MILDRETHAMLAQNRLGKRDRFLALLEALLVGRQRVEFFVAPSGHRDVQCDGAGFFARLHGCVESLDVFGFARQRSVENDAHVVTFDAIAELPDGVGVVGREACLRRAEAETAALLDHVEGRRLLAGSSGADGKRGGRTSHVAELGPLRDSGPRSQPGRGSGGCQHFSACHSDVLLVCWTAEYQSASLGGNV